MKKKVFLRENGKRQRRKRAAAVFLFFLFCFSFLIYRCLHLHLTHDPKLEKIARNQYRARIEEAPPRGNIYDASGEELAVSVPTYSLAARPGRMDPAETDWEGLSSLLGISLKDLKARLDTHKKYVWVKRNLSPREAGRLAKSSPKGMELVKGSKRFYPNREVASQLLGAVGVDNEGLAGLELFYDRTLRGGDENPAAYRDARGKVFETEETISSGPGDPHHLHLTIRKNIQYAAERELNAVCSETKARSCTAVVMDPRSGEILAMASYPNFNPNAYQSSDVGSWRNLAVTDTFEPGSTFKTILAAAALESGLVKPGDRFFCENGALRVGDRILHDHIPYGNLSVRDIIKVSSNIGIYKVGQRLGKNEFYRVIRQFGFGQKTGIDYPGEVAGFVPAVPSWQDIEFANISFGQGLRITPLQLASSYAVLANGGVRVRPTLVSHVTDAQGRILPQTRPKELGRVLKPQTARLLLDILKGVTEEGGTALKAALPGYEVAGKTGTAQKFVDGKYSHAQHVSSFIGMVPADNPRLVVLVSVDEPKGAAYGGVVAAPVFRKIAWAALMDLGVPPERSPKSPPVMRAEMGLDINNFQGLSKRKVLALLDQRGLACEVIGSGVAVSQNPPAGNSFGGTGCKIYFREE